MTSIATVNKTSFAATVSGPSISIAGFGSELLRWYDRARQRRQLKNMEVRMLDDIGVSRSQAHAEAGKPAWVD